MLQNSWIMYTCKLYGGRFWWCFLGWLDDMRFFFHLFTCFEVATPSPSLPNTKCTHVLYTIRRVRKFSAQQWQTVTTMTTLNQKVAAHWLANFTRWWGEHKLKQTTKTNEKPYKNIESGLRVEWVYRVRWVAIWGSLWRNIVTLFGNTVTLFCAHNVW